MSSRRHGTNPLSDYREFPVSEPLREYLLCLWTQSISDGSSEYNHRVLPDACIDVVFVNDEPPIVVGPWTQSFVARFAPGTNIIGARFHPGRASALLGVPASMLLNQSVGLDLVSNQTMRAKFGWISNQARGRARLSALETALIEWLPSAASIDKMVSEGINWLARYPNGTVEHLSRGIGISRRQLQRRFREAVGYGPKTFQSVLRFQRVLNLATRTENRPPLVSLAADAGYADQAHMTREIHRLSATRPTHLLGFARCTVCLSGLLADGWQ